LFSLNIPSCLTSLSWEPEALDRSVQGLIGVLLSLKMRPSIRYKNGSQPAQMLAKRIFDTINKESALFSFRPPENGVPPPLLLVLDRRDDPITPLLTQWTYQAMVHQLLGIKNNRVDLSNVAGVPNELKEVVLSADQDEFYASNLYSNYGEIAVKIRDLIESFQLRAKEQKKIESIADMKNFVENYPQFKKMSGTVNKHLVVISELSLQISKKSLLELSELEQDIACRADHSAQLQRVKKLVSDERITVDDALRLILIYAMRYERHANCGTVGLLNALKARNGRVHMVPKMLEYISQNARNELFNLAKITDAVKLTRNLIKGLKGVENVYTQHICVLKELLEEVFKGRSIDQQFPFISSEVPYRRPPSEVIVFIIGGATYEEALVVQQMNQSGYRVLLGGTTIHNSDSFMEEVVNATKGVAFKHPSARSLQAFHNANA
jgi:vacuolar protein sorting-associated protein 45